MKFNFLVFQNETILKQVFREGEDPASLDKDYWISRVGEVSTTFTVLKHQSERILYSNGMKVILSLQLSLQLQQSSEYWTDKVKDLNLQLEKQKRTPTKHQAMAYS